VERCSAIVLLGLALWAGPASAEDIVVHPLTVAIHPAVRDKYKLSQYDVEVILKHASDLLKRNNCNVGFALNGPINTFESAPADIKTADDLEAVHSVPADVKVVRSITFCVGQINEAGFLGCAWRPEDRQKTVVVSIAGSLPGMGSASRVWAHEYGHTTGLLHRFQAGNMSLMTPCDIQAYSAQLNQDECNHFRAGPVPSYPAGQGDACPPSSSVRRYRID
jgi:hypothetical protein